ncbi:MAG: anti-sigma factor [Candidatus Velthaea sp.]
MKHYTDEKLIDYIHGELGAAEDARVYAHLAECDACRARHETEAALGEQLRAIARSEEREFPSLIKAHVWAAIRDREPSFLERLQAFARPAIVVPVAAALAVAAYLGAPIVRNGNATPTVAAAYYLDEHAAAGQVNPLADHTNVNATFAERNPAGASAPLIDAADAATLDDVASGS